MQRRPLSLTTLAVSVAAAATCLATALPAAATTTVRYVALGDSYSSGVGTDDYSGSCGLSDQAYPQLWADANHPTSFTFAACSGATTADVRNTQVAKLTSSTTLVSLTIGGNDVGFTKILTTCVEESTDDCVAAVNQGEAYARSTLPGLLSSTYSSIRSHAPNAHVVVLSYPAFYDLNASPCYGLSSTDHQKLDEGINVVDGVIKTAVTNAGFTFADVRSSFVGHQICDGGSKWLHALNYGDIGESYHPNNDGHAKAYEPVFASKA